MKNPQKTDGPLFTIYTTRTCPYCTFAKQKLDSEGCTYVEKDITGDQHARDNLVERAGGQTTVPQIFYGDTHIGGYDDLCRWFQNNNT